MDRAGIYNPHGNHACIHNQTVYLQPGIVAISIHVYDLVVQEWLPEMQEAQEDCLHAVSNCGMVVVSDLTSDVNDIHPINKRDVGRRLSRW